MKNEHKHFIARLLVGVFLLFGLAFWTTNFVAHADTMTTQCEINNAHFLSNYFWSCAPTSGILTWGLFGTANTGTAYTRGRSGYNSGSCLASGMTVEYLTGGTNTIPLTLSGNTIYVLNSGNYITTGTINFGGDCIAVVGSGDVNVYSSGYINSDGIFYIGYHPFSIIDNITIDGKYDGGSSSHTGDYAGIHSKQSLNTTIHGIHISNTNIGLILNGSLVVNISDSSFFNNEVDGVKIKNFSEIGYITINNSLFFQNNEFGLYIQSSYGNIINNSNFFNNSGNGIQLSGSNNTIFNNISSYHNQQYGIEVASTGNIYYGTLNIFNNGTNLFGTTGNDEYLTGGNATDFSGFGWTTGTITTGGTISLATLINVRNGNGGYVLPWNATGLTLYGQQTWTGVSPIAYSFGTGIMRQIQGVMYSGTTIITGGSFSGNYFIGSFTKITTGEISVAGNLFSGHRYVNNATLIVPITGNGLYTYYRLFAGILEQFGEFPGQNTNGQLTLLSPDEGTGYLFAQLRNNGNRATHYMTEFIFDSLAPVITGTILPGTGTITNNGYYTTITGITLAFSDIHLSGATLSGTVLSSGTTTTGYWSGNFASNTTIAGEGVYQLTVTDFAGNSTGRTFTIDRINPSVTAISPSSGTNVTGNSSIAFAWSGTETNLSGYVFYISGMNTTGSYATGATGYTLTLGNGTYSWYILSTDKAGNTGTSIPQLFTLSVPLTGTIIITGANMIASGTTWYTKNYISFTLRSNKTALFSITGDIVITPYTGIAYSSSSTGYNLLVTTGTDGLKTLYVILSTGTNETGTTLGSIYLDTTAPSTPTLVTPASGATITGTTTSLTWSTSIDSGVGFSGYRYFVSTTGTVGTTGVIQSGFTSTVTGVSIASTLFGNTNITGTFYWYVKTLDKLSNSGVSTVQAIYYSGISDIIPDTFAFTSITNARLDRAYKSSTGTITGLSVGTYGLASINHGALYINGVMTGSTGYVKNGDTINIELISSDEYDAVITTTLTISSTTIATFRITTEVESTSDTTDYSDISTTLSATEKLQIISIFESLRDIYNGDKKDEFFTSFMVMLESKINDLGTSSNDKKVRDTLQYLYDLADQYGNEGGSSTNTDISTTSRIVGGVYTALNGKKYSITYDSAKKQFTSSNFITPKYFPTLDVLKYTIDINNPAGSQYANAKIIQARWGRIAIDGTRQTSPYTAPNHKVYYFFKTMDGEYSSYTFTEEKYFSTLEEVKGYIYTSNK